MNSLFSNNITQISRISQLSLRHYATKSKSKSQNSKGAINAKLVEISKTLSYILRHGGRSDGLTIRDDGFVRVRELLRHPRLNHVDFLTLENIVKRDTKGRFTLTYEGHGLEEPDVWWIRANQGHSMPVAQLELKRISSASEIPMAVHGTTEEAWKSISTQGLSRMNRNHIHMAQGVTGEGVISGIRRSSRILIYIDVEKALSAGITFYQSSNGVILSPGNENGVLGKEFFKKVERVKKHIIPILGWEGPEVTEGSDIAHVEDSKAVESSDESALPQDDVPTPTPQENPRPRKVQDEITFV